MQERIIGLLLARGDRSEHAALPSIRVLSRHFRASPNSVQRALRRLAERKAVYALPRKGYFWGEGPGSAPSLPLKPLPRALRIETEFLADVRSGYVDPFGRLPSLKMLSQRYRTSTRTLSAILSGLEDKGILRRDGRGYRMPESRPKVANIVALITPCDPTGQLRLQTDREIDFLKAVYRECHALDLEVRILGYAGGGRLLDRDGRPASPQLPGRNLLGFLVSTWLVPDAAEIVASLKSFRQPISLWWEHPPEVLGPFRGGGSRKTAYFNQSFGEAPGAMIAEALLSQGHSRALFLSPFHQSRWSQQRLLGLEKGMARDPEAHVHALTSDAHASPWSFQQQARSQWRALGRSLPLDDPRVLRRKTLNLIREVRRLLGRRPLQPAPTAWVCVNDEVAEIAMNLAKETEGAGLPYLVSFDNSALSYRNQIDSFAFNTEAMVREMLYHLSHPSSQVFARKAFIEIPGRLVRK